MKLKELRLACNGWDDNITERLRGQMSNQKWGLYRNNELIPGTESRSVKGAWMAYYELLNNQNND